jgi:DNA-binding response OmpR family regulator
VVRRLPQLAWAGSDLPRVLIVDDDVSVIDTFSRMLRLEGYDVSVAPSADAGLREVETSRPDAIILDLRMPLADGLEFLRRLRADDDRQRIPVAIVTGDYSLDEGISQELRQLGAQLYFKPVWLDALLRIVDELLHGTVGK